MVVTLASSPSWANPRGQAERPKVWVFRATGRGVEKSAKHEGAHPAKPPRKTYYSRGR
jgi:hypothetical protein